MIEINHNVLKECAKNLKFELSEEQIELLNNEFDSLLAQMNFLAAIPGIDQVEPMTFPFKCHSTSLREDEPEEPVDVNIELSNTKNRLGNQVKIPKVLG